MPSAIGLSQVPILSVFADIYVDVVASLSNA